MPILSAKSSTRAYSSSVTGWVRDDRANSGIRFRCASGVYLVYNSSGYENVSSLRMLEGLVDIYLPDLKYRSPQLSALYSHAPDVRDDRANSGIRFRCASGVYWFMMLT